MDAKSAARSGRTFGGWLRDMPRWKKVLLLAAIGTLVTGGVLMLTSGVSHGGGAGGGAPLQGNLVDGQPQSGGTRAATGDEPVAKGVFRLGFSFVAGFCLGSFVRAALRVASIAFGFWLAMTFVLSYFGLVVVDWNAIDQLWNRFSGNIESEWGDFQRFVTGSLPAAGLAVAGLAVGLKRH